MIDAINRTDVVGEWSVGDLDDVANGKWCLIFWFVFFGGFEDLIDFRLGNGGGLIVNTNEAGDPLSGANSDPGVVGEYHLDKDIAGEGFFLGFNLGTTTDDHF